MTQAASVWVIDDERSIRWVLDKALSKEGLDVRCFESGDLMLRQLASSQPDAILSDIRMPGIDGLDLLEAVTSRYPGLPVIIMTAHSDLDSAVASIQGGAFEYLPKPFEIEEAIAVVTRAIANNRREDSAASEEPPGVVTDIIGKAPAMQEVFRAIGRLSNSNIAVLLNGKSGTGKELVARALHRHSPRSSGPFIALNMAAIPKDLVESELFGHEKGAFTGAMQQRKGRFEQANEGTLFLDEIGDMPAETQSRLLRVLSDGDFYRVGGHESVSVDVRIIAATHQNLEQLVADNLFREDLFHRLNVIRIHIPLLRDRQEDIPALADHFLLAAARELKEEAKILSPEVLKFLGTLPWSGNVRQLENTCRWLTVMATGREVLMQDLPPELLSQQQRSVVASDWGKALKIWADRELANSDPQGPGLLDQALPIFEKTMILTALKHTGGRKKDAASLLGWGRNTLTRKIKELDMDSSMLSED
ncbi:MAG: nitrogen regulation protein NR(I) [Pseudomonadales bacterium]|jgi:two-component system nitrogen regulation response regulator GlnG|nr:nitrogen regulation protein NR(I) [Pseudomonadales bacterium]MDP7358037.1 nitrogen regulation protein NR(I) [Pseudomonadales bacterium]MDP7597506.1 nitrogen regulation protein NR(I) [Pseudomonadales bacterium]HJN52544.1 nitrogen regulation protein NR(I) [Pseudomonadales bacterium]|tara:strand:- start:364 stop:1794 length:1431 start_codon:yes stop_codon:yes gene_type:complete